MKIIHLPYQQIDLDRWDRCISEASNGRCYAYSWYLNQTADHWDALVTEDYQAVFPLVWNKKLILYKQIYQPFFTQQLGLFTTKKITPKLIHHFLDAIPSFFHKIDINLNEQNALDAYKDFSITPKPNFLLALHPSYEELKKCYASRLKKNLKIAKKTAPQIQKNIQSEVLVDFIANCYPPQLRQQITKDLKKLSQLISNIIERGKGFALGVHSNEHSGICAGAFFIRSHNRIIYLIGGSNEEGRKRNAMHFLLDHLIGKNAGTDQIFDFEGSAISSVAHFFKSFGAKESFYYRLEGNRLPGWMKSIQKWRSKF